MQEAAFSSTGFRIPAAQDHAAGSRHWAEHAAASLFFTFFPADCRLCNAPLIRISRLPVCETCLDALHPLARPERFEIMTGALVRRRETESQIGLTRHQRRENLRGAFKFLEPDRIAGRTILLVDDVFTTGTTAAECSKVLRRAGAKYVYVAT